jgi:prepilin-type N-terminal cleavage/methylation domain-containing protein
MLKLQKNLQAGFTIIELLIVIAIIGILATLVLTNFQGAQAKGRDTVRKNDINSIYQKLEEYYNENGGYPDGALSAATFPGIDAGALSDADNATIVSTFTNSATQPTLTLTTTNEYAYAAYDGCNTTTPTGSTCGKYILGTFLERESQYTKTSLN